MSGDMTTDADTSTGPNRDELLHTDVTVELARAGFIFQMYSNANLGVYWQLLFNIKDAKSLEVEVQVHGEFIAMLCNPGTGIPSEKLCRVLLKMNGRVASGRIGFNSLGEVLAVTHFQRKLLSAETLRYHVNMILDTALDIREQALREDATMESPKADER